MCCSVGRVGVARIQHTDAIAHLDLNIMGDITQMALLTHFLERIILIEYKFDCYLFKIQR